MKESLFMVIILGAIHASFGWVVSIPIGIVVLIFLFSHYIEQKELWNDYDRKEEGDGKTDCGSS